MFRSRLSRFFFASAVALSLTSFCVAHNNKSGPLVPLSEKQFEELPPSSQQHGWFSFNHKWAVDDIFGQVIPFNTLKVWNLSTGRLIKLQIPWGNEDGLGDKAIAPNGLLAVVRGLGTEPGNVVKQSCEVIIYNLRTRRYFHLPLSQVGDYEGVQQLRFVQGGSQLYLATARTIYKFDTRTKRLIKRFRIGDKWRPKGADEDEVSVALTPDAHYYIQFHPDTLKMSLWDVRKQKLIKRFQLPIRSRGSKYLDDLVYSSNARVFKYAQGVGGDDEIDYFIDTLSGRTLWTTHIEVANNKQFFSPDGKEYFIIFKDHVQVRDTHTGRVLRHLLTTPHASRYWLSTDGKTLFSEGSVGGGKVKWYKQRAR